MISRGRLFIPFPASNGNKNYLNLHLIEEVPFLSKIRRRLRQGGRREVSLLEGGYRWGRSRVCSMVGSVESAVGDDGSDEDESNLEQHKMGTSRVSQKYEYEGERTEQRD